MTSPNLYKTIKILAAIGILLALYLLWQRYLEPAWQPCNISAGINCDAIIKGPVSTVFGVPSALIGLLGYVVILIASILQNKKLLLGMTTFGLAFCAWLGYREIFDLKVLCPVCVTCQVVMTTAFILSLILFRRK